MENISAQDLSNFAKLIDLEIGMENVYMVKKEVRDDLKGYTHSIEVYDKKSGKIDILIEGDVVSPKENSDGDLFAYISNENGNTVLYIMQGDDVFIPSFPNELKIEEIEWHHIQNKLLVRGKLKKDEQTDPRIVTNLVYKTGTEFISQLPNFLFIYNHIEKSIYRIYSERNVIQAKWFGDEIIAQVKLGENSDLSDYIDIILIRDKEENYYEKYSRIFNPYIFKPSFMSINPYNLKASLILVLEQIYPLAQRAQIMKWANFHSQDNVINKKFDRSVTEIQWVDSETAFMAVNINGKNQIYKYYNEEFTEFSKQSFSNELFKYRDGEIYSIGTDIYHPNALWKITDDSVELLYDPNNSWIANKKICNPKELWFENEEGTRYQGWYFMTHKKKCPLILSIHGGPYVMWNNSGSMWLEWQSQVAAGYNVLAINPVGSDGYGEEFLRQICGNWGKKDSRDLLLVLDNLIIVENIDTDRIYVTGGSYAGFQTVNLIAIDQRFKAAVAQRGVYNFLTMDAGGDIARFAELEYTGDKELQLERLWNDSPISKCDHIKTPLLLIHSEKDYRVPIHQAEHLFIELRKRGNIVEFIRYPDEGHELSRSGSPYRIIDRLDRIIEWFERYK